MIGAENIHLRVTRLEETHIYNIIGVNVKKYLT